MDIPAKAVREGLSAVKWHGRFEVLCEEPLIIYDGAHNPDGIRCAADSIRRYFDKKVVMFIGVMADKEYGLYADMLGELADMVFTVKPDNPRSLDSSALAETFSSKGVRATACDDYSEGVKAAYDYAAEKRLPLIALGTLYMYRQFTETLEDIRC
jgi:dihydrofolate synthase/folylpolyglutamate synthase